ncbi:MAG: alpha-L-fucosidase [Acidobacteria bacterium]|nr:alpha-L-fucosidase [Acidobacteriota bacterium]
MPTLTRRHFGQSLAAGAAAVPLSAQFGPPGPPAKYEADWASLRRHPLPEWYANAKFGIFVHWGLYSVPAWAPPTGELGKVDWNKWFYQNPYAEWYLNSIRLKESKTYAHHAAKYGAGYDYYRFAETFNRDNKKWQPDEWASLFKSVGARYVVLTSKHHDGFPLWPSKVKNPRRPDLPLVERDLVGDLSQAVRNKGMKMALYYSGGLDWTFSAKPVATLADVASTVVQEPEYAAYADAHWYELMDRYQPAILWNDIGYPKVGKLEKIFSDFYNRDPQGLVNNRFGVEHFDFSTPEYSRYDTIVEKKWESCRGLGFSFGYNQVEGPEHVLAADKLVELLVDVVSKNGNLLLNVGPRPDGSISEIQQDRLRTLGKWLEVHGEGIFDTKPWVRAAAREADADVRFTRKGDTVYAFLLKPTSGGTIRVPNVMAGEGTRVSMLGQPGTLAFTQAGRDLMVKGTHRGPLAAALKITPAPWQLVRETK